LRARLPDEFIVDGYWDGKLLGRKTATRPPNTQPRAFSARVFADAVGFCELRSWRWRRVCILGLQAHHLLMFPPQMMMACAAGREP
jgi:hypothetical protein